MRNNKGQALVEFVIILPITLVLFFCIIDFARVITLKGTLESKSDDVVTFYESGKTLEEINNLMSTKDYKYKISLVDNGEYVTITVSEKIKPITPGFSYVLKDVFDVSVTRVIKNE